MPSSDRITVAEAAALLGLSRQGVAYALQRGHLTGARVSPKLWLVDRASVERYRTAPRDKGGRPRKRQERA